MSAMGSYAPVEVSADGELIRCEICLGWFSALGVHVSHKHGVSADEYRREHGLMPSTSLVAPEYRARLVQIGRDALRDPVRRRKFETGRAKGPHSPDGRKRIAEANRQPRSPQHIAEVTPIQAERSGAGQRALRRSQGVRYEVVCRGCGVRFETVRSGNQAYCTKDCMVKHLAAEPYTPTAGHRGEQSPRAKLYEQDVLAIRASTASLAELAHHYGVTRANIRAIQTRRTWAHLPE